MQELFLVKSRAKIPEKLGNLIRIPNDPSLRKAVGLFFEFEFSRECSNNASQARHLRNRVLLSRQQLFRRRGSIRILSGFFSTPTSIENECKVFFWQSVILDPIFALYTFLSSPLCKGVSPFLHSAYKRQGINLKCCYKWTLCNKSDWNYVKMAWD